MFRHSTFAVILAAGLSAALARADSPNDEVVKFCQESIGQKIGSGECADLANVALQAAGAKTVRDFQDHPRAGDYVWGELVAVIEPGRGGKKGEGKLADAKPGDIIQYGNAMFKGNVNGQKYNSRAVHHTAILAAVSPNGRELRVWEQNRNGEKIVAATELRLGDLKQGWLRIYRPSATEASKPEAGAASALDNGAANP